MYTRRDIAAVVVGWTFICLQVLGLGASADQTLKYEPSLHKFDVIPGGSVLTFEKTLNGITCSFQYACQGGTKEEWDMVISQLSADAYTCEVVRPMGMSYLFFQQFEMKIHGATLSSATAFGNDQETPCDKGEFIVDKANKKVSNAANFKSHLHRVMAIISTDGKKEKKEEKEQKKEKEL